MTYLGVFKTSTGNMAETTFFLPCLLRFPEKTRSCFPIGKKYGLNWFRDGLCVQILGFRCFIMPQQHLLVSLMVECIKTSFCYYMTYLGILETISGNNGWNKLFLCCVLLFPEKIRNCFPIGKYYDLNWFQDPSSSQQAKCSVNCVPSGGIVQYKHRDVVQKKRNIIMKT